MTAIEQILLLIFWDSVYLCGSRLLIILEIVARVGSFSFFLKSNTVGQ